MNEYRVEYICADGFEGEVTVCAVNRIMAFEVFETFGFEDVILVDVFLIE